MVRAGFGVYFIDNLDGGGGTDWPVGRREATWDHPGAAVHHHSLHRLNVINDCLNK